MLKEQGKTVLMRISVFIHASVKVLTANTRHMWLHVLLVAFITIMLLLLFSTCPRLSHLWNLGRGYTSNEKKKVSIRLVCQEICGKFSWLMVDVEDFAHFRHWLPWESCLGMYKKAGCVRHIDQAMSKHFSICYTSVSATRCLLY